MIKGVTNIWNETAFRLHSEPRDFCLFCTAVPIVCKAELFVQIVKKTKKTWRLCEVVRYPYLALAAITIFNFSVISLERYFSVCYPTHCLYQTAQKLVKRARILGAMIPLLVVSTVNLYIISKVKHITHWSVNITVVILLLGCFTQVMDC